jgi:N4-(beta-N-acetylglucosaminyl)-L-asparaginase
MLTRRGFLLRAAAAAAAAPALAADKEKAPAPTSATTSGGGQGRPPVAVSSENGLRCVAKAVERMKGGADPLDAAIDGVAILEADPEEHTVGYGGMPNEEGVVQLDACVMHGPTGRAGAVASLEGVKHPSRVAKLVMESTDHILLVGPGARRFAEMHGFPLENLLTPFSRKVWLYWKQNLSATDKWLEPELDKLDPEIRDYVRGHPSEFRTPPQGTVHVSALSAKGDLGGCTSTSGLFFKMPGRVGDSPIIGAGCFTDNAVGSAGSTGRGEANIAVCGAHTAVELMRLGQHPREACLEVLRRIAGNTREKRLLDKRGRPAFGIKFYAVNKKGDYGSASMWGGDPKRPARFAVADAKGARLEQCAPLFEGRPEV